MHTVILDEKEINALFSLMREQRNLTLWSGNLFYTPFVNPYLLENADENDYYDKYGDSLVVVSPLLSLLVTHLLNGVLLAVKFMGDNGLVGVYKLSNKDFSLMNLQSSQLEHKDLIKEAFRCYRKKDKEGALITAMLLYSTLNNYILEGNHTEEIPEVERPQKQGKRTHKKKYPKNGNVCIDRCYRLVFPEKEDTPQIDQKKEPHKIEYKCDCWEVRGFYRTLKNGDKTFVKPYLKGKNKDKGVPADKTYHIHPAQEETDASATD